MLWGALLIHWSEIAQEVVVLAHFCTHLSKVKVFYLFRSFAPHHVSVLAFNRITGSTELSIALYFCTTAAFTNQTLYVFRCCSTERYRRILLTSLWASMWEEVIAGRLSLCAMSSSTAKFRTRGKLNMQGGDLGCRRFTAVFPKS